MILVNVVKSWPQATTDQERLDAVEGVWPLHSFPREIDRTAAAFGAAVAPSGPIMDGSLDGPSLREVANLLAHADYLLAIVKNEIVDTRHIDRTLIAGGKVVFITSPAPEASAAVGQRISDDLAWKRGEAWPIKVSDSAWLEQAAAARTTTLGEYKLTLAPDGSLHVATPERGAVVVSGARGFTPGQALAPVALRAARAVPGADGGRPDVDPDERAVREDYELEQVGKADRQRAVALFAGVGIEVPR